MYLKSSQMLTAISAQHNRIEVAVHWCSHCEIDQSVRLETPAILYFTLFDLLKIECFGGKSSKSKLTKQ